MKKETIIINGREYEIKDTTASDILGMALVVCGLSFLMVATFGTVALSILGVL
jgi:hypothetical protein